MNADLLTRLQKADQATWDEVDRLSRMFNGVPWVNGKHWQDQLCSDGNKATREALKEAWLQAWLQHCLQAAIRARGWGYAIGRSSKGMTSASVYVPGGEGETVMGYDDAEALCRAYLAAIDEKE